MPHNLGEGLVLRRATAADSEAVAALNGEIHADSPQTFSAGMAAWTRDLMNGNHPTYRASDWTVVEDTRAGRIASTMCLLSQTWSYSGISFGVGRPELVGTLPEYRRRGLVRSQIAVLHAWSAQRGELLGDHRGPVVLPPVRLRAGRPDSRRRPHRLSPPCA